MLLNVYVHLSVSSPYQTGLMRGHGLFKTDEESLMFIGPRIIVIVEE